ncbi:MAG: hypothetical protein B7Z40_03385 [Bosea sp. 12-68-7]|nr:MAG: hypothetical protein B7Z40_03385 [Bosea sp. 12-68-7]OYX02291.1 MAG: hypothetical protein B7Z14_03905 [Bosea sp. 32-68-6]
MQQLAELARAKPGITRSPLYRWLRARHETFASLLEETRPEWRTLAEGFARLGMTASDGGPIAPETVRHTWWRVRRDVVAFREKRAAEKPPKPAVMPVSRPAPTPPPQSLTEPLSGPGAALARLRAEMNARSGRKSDG